MTAPPTRLPWLFAALAVVVCLGFAAFTGHIWEDYSITFRSSLHLATGHGLVYQPGERVHSFTSPLGTLLPALFALGGGDHVAVRSLWWFRVLSAAALGGAVWLAARTMLRAGLAPVATATACTLWILDPKTIDFAINGQEDALLVFFLIVTWRAFVDGPRLWPCALGCAGLQWTRPDGVVFFGALAVAWWFFGPPTDHRAGWRTRWRHAGRAAALGLMLYLPWMFFAWTYYGSPLPHTMLAKVSHHPPGELTGALLLYPWRLLFGHVALHDVFTPAYFFFGGWPGAIAGLSRWLAVGGALAWLWPATRPAGRVASAAFFLGGFYVEYLPRSPWYYPGWQALAFVAWAWLLDAAWRTGADAFRRTALRVLGGTVVAVQAALLLAVAWQMRAQQTLIEDHHRAEIGRWLRAHAAPGERVYLEPLGYIGFFPT
ncbi:MAG: hypothetical protein EXS32_12420 [Opitutus sp.]|nr:hypothetical protein [Opitutus sp.]